VAVLPLVLVVACVCVIVKSGFRPGNELWEDLGWVAVASAGPVLVGKKKV